MQQDTQHSATRVEVRNELGATSHPSRAPACLLACPLDPDNTNLSILIIGEACNRRPSSEMPRALANKDRGALLRIVLAPQIGQVPLHLVNYTGLCFQGMHTG